jgi:hypothetical protein
MTKSPVNKADRQSLFSALDRIRLVPTDSRWPYAGPRVRSAETVPDADACFRLLFEVGSLLGDGHTPDDDRCCVRCGEAYPCTTYALAWQCLAMASRILLASS